MIGSILKLFAGITGLILESRVAKWIRYVLSAYYRWLRQQDEKEFHEQQRESVDQAEHFRQVEDDYFNAANPPGAVKGPHDPVQ